MKKLVLLLIVIMPSITIFGQTTKGSFVLSGGTSLQFISSNIKSVYDGKTGDEYSQNTFSIVPSFGYFIVDNLAIGVSGTISISTSNDEDGNKYSTTSTLIMPTALYYFPLDGKIRPVLQIGAGYSTMTDKFTPKTGTNDKSSASGLAINFGGGVSYFVKENIAFNLGISYTKTTLTDGDDDKSKMKLGSLGSNIGISVFF